MIRGRRSPEVLLVLLFTWLAMALGEAVEAQAPRQAEATPAKPGLGVSQGRSPTTEDPPAGTFDDPSQTPPPEPVGSDQPSGLASKDLGPTRFSFGLDYLLLGGQFMDGFTPSFASNITSILEFRDVPLSLMIRLRPEALVSVNGARKEAKSSYAFEQQVRQGARASLAQALGIPVGLVDTLVPQPVIASTEAKVRAVAGGAVDDRIDYSTALKTMLDGFAVSVRIGEKLEVSVGKDHPYFGREFLPGDSSVIFGSVPNAQVRYHNDLVVPGIRVYHDRPSIESPFGIANGYMRTILREGHAFFAINPDSVEVSASLEQRTLDMLGLKGVGMLAFGAGKRNEDPYGFVRLDLQHDRAYLRNLVNWQDTPLGLSTQYSGLGKVRVVDRLVLGMRYYLHSGDTPDSFHQLQPFTEITVRKRPWLGWLGDHETHVVVKRGYSRGNLVEGLTGTSDIVRDWNLEILLVRGAW